MTEFRRVLFRSVGEIIDEFDQEEPEIEQLDSHSYLVDGGVAIDDINDLLHTNLPDDEWDTVAGLVLSLLGRVPGEGEQVVRDGLTFEAREVESRRIGKVLITRSATTTTEVDEV